MAAVIFLGASLADTDGMESDLAVRVDDDGYYWHLYPYFESAKLPRGMELIDLYGANEIEGYELARLRSAMNVAKNDLAWRPESWEVVTGWRGSKISQETEIRRPVEKQALSALIERLVLLVDHCRSKGLKMCVFGD